MWPKFVNSSISMREVIIPQFYMDLTKKTFFINLFIFGIKTYKYIFTKYD